MKRSERGFGLIEVMVAVAIMGVIAVGISSLLSDMFRMQKKSNVVGVINQMRNVMTAAIQNGESWTLTANDTDTTTGNPDMTCMRIAGFSNCVAGTYDLNLKNVDGTELFYARTAANGFTLDGRLCTTYPSDPCPLSWNLRWVATCPGAAANCPSPTIRVTGRLEYTPTTIPILGGGFNPNNYEINVIRGAAAIRNDAVTVSYIENDNSGEAASCRATWVQRSLNTVIADPGNNLINKSGTALSPANVVTLRSGTYNCRIQAPGFKNGGNRIRIVATTSPGFTTVESSVGIAALNGGGSVNMTLETTLILPQDTTFRVDHTCTDRPSDSGFPTLNNDFMLGVPVPNPTTGTYTGTTYTTVSCTRTG